MLETIKAQFESGKALAQSRYYHLHKRELWPSFYHDLYPIGLEYYHELNPYFTFNIHTLDHFNFAKTFFVKDGKAPFASFLLKNYSLIPKLKTHFIIHPDLAPLVPTHLRDKFSCWKIIQPKKIKLEDAKKVFVFGILTEPYLGGPHNVTQKLKKIQTLSPDQDLDIYLPIRKNAFETDTRENLLTHKILVRVKEMAENRKLNFFTSREVTEKTNFKDHYLIDLAVDNFIVADNYMHYMVASKGGTVEALDSTPPPDSYFKIDLSFQHEVHFMPLPIVDSIFMDLLFVRKRSSIPTTFNDPGINALLRKQDPELSPQA